MGRSQNRCLSDDRSVNASGLRNSSRGYFNLDCGNADASGSCSLRHVVPLPACADDVIEKERYSLLPWHESRSGTNRRLEGGQSMSALPRYFRHQLVPLLPGHHRPQCRDISLCFRSWYVRARAGQPLDCLSADRSRWPLCVAASACQTVWGPARRFRSSPIRAARTGGLSYCGQGRDGR